MILIAYMSTISFWSRGKKALELARMLGLASMIEGNQIRIKVKREAPLFHVTCTIGKESEKPDCVILLDDTLFYDFILESKLIIVKGNKTKEGFRIFGADTEIGLLGALAATTNIIALKSLINVTEQNFNNSSSDLSKKQLELGYEVARKKVLGVGN